MISNVSCFRTLPRCYRIAFPLQDNTAVRSRMSSGWSCWTPLEYCTLESRCQVNYSM